MDDRHVRVQVSCYYGPGKNFNGRDCWWFDVPHSFFEARDVQELYLVCQKNPNSVEDFYVLICPRTEVDPNLFERVSVNDRPVRRIHIDAENFAELRKGLFNFRKFLRTTAPIPH